MANNGNRFLAMGMNHVNGYDINVTRVVSAQQNGDTSRTAAKYFGNIVKISDGTAISMGIKGMTSTKIKEIIGLREPSRPRGNKSENERRLEQLKEIRLKMIELGLATDDIDNSINQVIAAIDADRAREEERKDIKEKIKECEKDIQKYSKLIEELDELGEDTTKLNTRLAQYEGMRERYIALLQG